MDVSDEGEKNNDRRKKSEKRSREDPRRCRKPVPFFFVSACAHIIICNILLYIVRDGGTRLISNRGVGHYNNSNGCIAYYKPLKVQHVCTLY